MGLETILEWKMTPDEGDVFRIALIYEQEFRKFFGSESDGQLFRRNTIPANGDPRKSSVFRHCWKLRRETRGLIESQEYRNYIKANLFIIKHHKGRVEPNCVTGDRAWIRYKVWKRLHDNKIAEINAQTPPPSISTTDPKLIAELDKTKKFLFEKCDGKIPNVNDIKSFLETNKLKFWTATSKISPYYLILSPFIKNIGCEDLLFTVCNSSKAVYESKITDQIKNYFAYEFKYEFDNAT